MTRVSSHHGVASSRGGTTSYYFDNGFTQRGDYDIGRDIRGYGFPEDMSGMSVLDIGTGAGWFATYFEQHGATVTTVDARGYCDFDVFGRAEYPDVTAEKAAPDRLLPDGSPIYYSPVSQGFWIMKDILGLKAEYVNSRVYDVGQKLKGRKFDLIFMGAVLMHLRDPIGALMALRPLCADRLDRDLLPTGGEDEPPMMRMFEADLIYMVVAEQALLVEVVSVPPAFRASRRIVFWISLSTVRSPIAPGTGATNQSARSGQRVV